MDKLFLVCKYLRQFVFQLQNEPAFFATAKLITVGIVNKSDLFGSLQQP